MPLNLGDIQPDFVIKDDDNNVHLMSFYYYGDDEKYHYKAALVDLIPTSIIALNEEKHEVIVVGFVKEFERRNKPTFIPMYLKRLIVQFYPAFV